MDLHPQPKNYLVESVLVTILCCLPLGIVALINSSAVNTAYENGNFAEAEEKSAAAKKWMTYGLITGAVIYVITLILWVLVVGLAVAA